jgi:toxin YhaV
VFLHPLIIEQLERLVSQVEALQKKDPAGYVSKNATKRLAAISKLYLNDVPQDPSASKFRQGDTLGASYKHWFRAKFLQQYRLFFRYDDKSKIIVYVWVNDEETKRAYNSKDDAYRVFGKMLSSGHPPDKWEDLLAQSAKASGPLNKLLDRVGAILE